QMMTHGKVMDWTAVGAGALEGAITGVVAAYTGGAGTSFKAAATANSLASVGGGIAKDAVNGQQTTVSDVAVNALAGGAGGVVAKKVDGVAKNVVANKVTNSVVKTAVEKGVAGGAARGVTKATVKQGAKAVENRSNANSTGVGKGSSGVKMDGGIQAASSNKPNMVPDKAFDKSLNLDRDR